MLKFFRLIILFPYCAIAFSLGTLYSLFRPFNPNNVFLTTRLLRPVLWLMGIKLEVENLETLKKNGPAVIVSNHQNNWDMFPACAILPERTVSLGKSSIIYIPFFGLYYWLSGNILIKRENPEKAKKTLDKVRELLHRRNIKIWILPEGTRSRGRGLLPFKKGAFHTAVHTQLPIIPVCFNSYNGKIDLNKWRAGEIRARVLSPIQTFSMGGTQIAELAEHCHRIMKAEIMKLDGVSAT